VRESVRRRLLIPFAIVASLVLLYAFAGEPNWIEVTHHTLRAPVPRAIRIAHITDLHTLGMGMRERRLIGELMTERPDLIVVTGDIETPGGTRDCYLAVLRSLHAPLGVWSVPGNWEYWIPIPARARLFAEAGVRELMNEAAEVTPGVWLAGFDDALAGSRDPDRALAPIPAGACAIAVFHEPILFDLTAGRYTLALAGHTHGGQVRVPFLPPLLLPHGCGRYVAGWFERKGSRMYVSRGIGMSVVPIRLFCRPELAIITLVPDGTAAGVAAR